MLVRGGGAEAMKATRWMVCAAAATALAVLPGCGKRFPVGEHLLPETYGPPFGAALKANMPEHPHSHGDLERYAQADGAESKTYRTHAACHAALQAAVQAHHGKVERISLTETVGSYDHEGVVHEHRCTDYVLSHRSWCAPAAGHGEQHKRKAPDAACKGEGTHH
jgi:hypothetical protein